MIIRIKHGLCLFLALLATNIFAVDITGNAQSIEINHNHANMTSVVLRGPADFKTKSDNTYIWFDTELVDGLYQYQIMGMLDYVYVEPSDGSNNRPVGSVPTNPPVGVIDSGYFNLIDGVVQPNK